VNTWVAVDNFRLYVENEIVKNKKIELAIDCITTTWNPLIGSATGKVKQ